MNIRIAGCVEYCGANYHGWQRQNHASSIQESLERAISKVAGQAINAVSAGRTDTGVHGIGQIFHFDTSSQRELFQWVYGINTYLPNDVTVTWVCLVPFEFHARFSALSRSYRYIILNRSVKPGYLFGRVTWHRQNLDIRLMQEGISYLVGEFDFSAFRAAGCQNQDPVKIISSLEINQEGSWVWLDITANGFLQHMVRNIVGSLFEVGQGKQPPCWIKAVLDSRDRMLGGMTAPPEGLYFVKVSYDPVFQLPEPPEVCRFW